MSETIDAAGEAMAIIERHGTRAGQFAVDRMVAALRSGDLAAAQRWDEIGRHIAQHRSETPPR